MSDNRGSFRQELMYIINKYSMENGSDTPDWILAEYLYNSLVTYEEAVKRRDRWYGRIGDMQMVTVDDD